MSLAFSEKCGKTSLSRRHKDTEKWKSSRIGVSLSVSLCLCEGKNPSRLSVVLLPEAGATFQPGQNGRVSEPCLPIMTAENGLGVLLTYSEHSFSLTTSPGLLAG